MPVAERDTRRVPRVTVAAEHRSLSNQTLSSVLGLTVVVCLFCAPLFVGLGGRDLGSDEAIYAYAVDQILDTGEWLTPRLIPYDGPLLEKPPLKFWMLAGAMHVGLLPRDEVGLRVLDALFGAAAFVYVFWLGRRLAGPVCGLVAVLVLFTQDRLLFEHGLRSNNMEAALFLAYCGGAYHFARWVEDGAARRPMMHALATAAYFTLGFMTKFVAVLFLPLVCALALAWRRDAWVRLRSNWRDWTLPVIFVCAVSTPWFVYEALHAGWALWQTMVGEQLYTRFTGLLDPRHLQPGHYYYSATWAGLALAGSQWLAVAGMLLLGVRAWTGGSWLARLLLVWWFVPFAVMSIGTSKIFHYAYPFLPPIALGAGVAADMVFRAIERGIGATIGAAGGALRRNVTSRWPLSASRVRSVLWAPPAFPSGLRRLSNQALVASAVVATAVAVWTVMTGLVRLEPGGVELLRNSSAVLPMAVAAVCLALAGHARVLIPALALAAMAVVLPVSAYPRAVEQMSSIRNPLGVLRDCLAEGARQPVETHVYPTYDQLLDHSLYYYLRQVGPWIEHDGSPKNDELLSRLYDPNQQALLILATADYERFVQQIARGEIRAPRWPSGVVLSEQLVLLTPGPFEVCAAAAISKDGRGIRGLSAEGTRP